MNAPIHPFALICVAAALLLPGGCASGPSYADYVSAAAAHLDSGRHAAAVEFLELALDASADGSKHDRALAMLVEARLGQGLVAEARDALDVLCQESPAVFLTWKAAAVLELRVAGTTAARGALQAAKGVARGEGHRAWLRDFEALLDGLDAFAAGDFAAARRCVADIDNEDVAPAAAWVVARLDALEQVGETRVSAARRIGTQAGLLDLWHSAAGRPEAQREVVEFARRIHQALSVADLESSVSDLELRKRLSPPGLGIARLAGWAGVAAERAPVRLRQG
ncbi:MAG: hypothetical protein IPM29_04615 [Planctomycetes bacterium]|nr:hypothetical protein [Planctomycetota bacterium]